MTAAALPQGDSFGRFLFQPGDRPFVSATRAGVLFALANVAGALLANLFPGGEGTPRPLTTSFIVSALFFAPIIETLLLGLVVAATHAVQRSWIPALLVFVLAGFAHWRGNNASFVGPAVAFALMTVQFRTWLVPNRDYMVAALGVAWTHFIINAALLSLRALLA